MGALCSTLLRKGNLCRYRNVVRNLQMWYLLSPMWRSCGRPWTRHSGCGVGSDLPRDQGGTLDPDTLKVHGAPAPEEKRVEEPCVPSNMKPPPPPEYLPDMKDTMAISFMHCHCELLLSMDPQGQGSQLHSHLQMLIELMLLQEASQDLPSVHSQDGS